jgi:hypothetical protein
MGVAAFKSPHSKKKNGYKEGRLQNKADEQTVVDTLLSMYEKETIPVISQNKISRSIGFNQNHCHDVGTVLLLMVYLLNR